MPLRGHLLDYKHLLTLAISPALLREAARTRAGARVAEGRTCNSVLDGPYFHGDFSLQWKLALQWHQQCEQRHIVSVDVSPGGSTGSILSAEGAETSCDTMKGQLQEYLCSSAFACMTDASAAVAASAADLAHSRVSATRAPD